MFREPPFKIELTYDKISTDIIRWMQDNDLIVVWNLRAAEIYIDDGLPYERIVITVHSGTDLAAYYFYDLSNATLFKLTFG